MQISFTLRGEKCRNFNRLRSCTNLFLSSHKFLRADLKFLSLPLHNFNYSTRNKRNTVKILLLLKAFDLVDDFYVLWYTYYIDIAFGWNSWYWIYISDIFKEVKSKKVEVWIFLCYTMIHRNFKFLILTVSFLRNFFKFGIMKVIVRTKMCFYFQENSFCQYVIFRWKLMPPTLDIPFQVI